MPLDSIKDVVRSSVKVAEFDKHPKKAGGHIGWNVVEITIKMKTIVRNSLMIKIIKLRLRNLDNYIYIYIYTCLCFCVGMSVCVSICLYVYVVQWNCYIWHTNWNMTCTTTPRQSGPGSNVKGVFPQITKFQNWCVAINMIPYLGHVQPPWKHILGIFLWELIFKK